MNRFKVVDGSVSAHCCFEASVLDTHEPGEMIHKNGRVVCECLDTDDANRIARALEHLYEREAI